MYDRPNLGLEEAVPGLLAALEEAHKDEAEGRPVVVPIPAPPGDPLPCARPAAGTVLAMEGGREHTAPHDDGVVTMPSYDGGAGSRMVRFGGWIG